MRVLFVLGWLMVPVGVAAYHYGPGQERLRSDSAAQALSAADRYAQDKEWSHAVEKYDEAWKMLPAGKTSEARRIRLERAKAQMMAQKLPEANADLESLLAEVEKDTNADPKLLADTRRALANSQYYMTWLLRLEGQARSLWEPQIESARQIYHLLAEQAEQAGDTKFARQDREDLEAAVRLARMDLSELQALSLPSQCCGCCSGLGRCVGKGKNPGNGGQPKDVRGASSGPPPDNSGS
jgi:predicted negative regulator of RcsB-dependent stress response